MPPIEAPTLTSIDNSAAMIYYPEYIEVKGEDDVDDCCVARLAMFSLYYDWHRIRLPVRHS